MSGFIWIAAIVVLNLAIRAIAKKAEENRAMQARRGAAQQPTAASATQAAEARPVARATNAGGFPAASARPVTAPPPLPTQGPNQAAMQPRATQARSRAEVEAQHRARVQAKAQADAKARARAQAEAQARARAQAQAQAKAQAQAEARARAQVQRAPAKQGGSALQRAANRAGGEEAAALHSREKVAQSLARVQAAERKVADTMPGHNHFGAAQPAAPSIAGNIRALLRDPKRVREAFVLSEVLGPCRGSQSAPADPFGLLGGR